MDVEYLLKANNIDGLNIDNYKKIFEIISLEYKKYCESWSQKISYPINLKRKCVSDIFNINTGMDEEFKAYMDSFIDGLTELYFNIISRIGTEVGIDVRGRVKEPQSIINKLNKKNVIENGKYPIIKCLNDLLGIRIIDKSYKDNICMIIQYLNSSEYKVRHMERNNNGYIGYHVYFKLEQNIYFPIELQIWDLENEQNIIDSHILYKQEYIGWEEKYNKL